MARVELKWLHDADFGAGVPYQKDERETAPDPSEFFGEPEVDDEEGFEEWFSKVEGMDAEGRRDEVWRVLRSRMSDEDVRCLDRITSLLRDNPDAFTDILWLERELRGEFPDINPGALFGYVVILQRIGFIKTV